MPKNELLIEAREIIAKLVEGLVEEGYEDWEGVDEAKWFLEKTQPELYAIQFRSMRTAIHSVLIFESRSLADQFMAIFTAEEKYPEEAENIANSVAELAIDMFEIDWRNPPKEYKGNRLIYSNESRHYVPVSYLLG